jgi:hypothetical protein
MGIGASVRPSRQVEAESISRARGSSTTPSMMTIET